MAATEKIYGETIAYYEQDFFGSGRISIHPVNMIGEK